MYCIDKRKIPKLLYAIEARRLLMTEKDLELEQEKVFKNVKGALDYDLKSKSHKKLPKDKLATTKTVNQTTDDDKDFPQYIEDPELKKKPKKKQKKGDKDKSIFIIYIYIYIESSKRGKKDYMVAAEDSTITIDQVEDFTPPQVEEVKEEEDKEATLEYEKKKKKKRKKKKDLDESQIVLKDATDADTSVDKTGVSKETSIEITQKTQGGTQDTHMRTTQFLKDDKDTSDGKGRGRKKKGRKLEIDIFSNEYQAKKEIKTFQFLETLKVST